MLHLLRIETLESRSLPSVTAPVVDLPTQLLPHAGLLVEQHTEPVPVDMPQEKAEAKHDNAVLDHHDWQLEHVDARIEPHSPAQQWIRLGPAQGEKASDGSADRDSAPQPMANLTQAAWIATGLVRERGRYRLLRG